MMVREEYLKIEKEFQETYEAVKLGSWMSILAVFLLIVFFFWKTAPFRIWIMGIIAILGLISFIIWLVLRKKVPKLREQLNEYRVTVEKR